MIYHMNVSVRGVLLWPNREIKRILKSVIKADGTHFQTVDEFRNALMDELANGHEVLPMGAPCEGFDFKKGCPGHREAEDDHGKPKTA